jgi:predicted O-linked N-acetylglucosamine transferase (SPINDLY family)
VGRHDAAVEMIGKAIAIRNDVPFFHNNLANALKAQGKPGEAASGYRRALALKPDYADALVNLGVILKAQGKLEEAAECYEKALKLNPASAEANNNLGNIRASQERFDDAVAAFRRAIALRPDYAEAHYNLGNIFKAQARPDDALACYERAMALKPDYAEAHYNLGNLLNEQGKLDKAAEHLASAIELRPDYCEAYINLGNVRYAQAKMDDAVMCYEQALRINSDSAEAHCYLGATLQLQNKFDAAITHLDQARALDPKSATILDHMGTAIKDKGKLEEAIGYYRRALELSPDFAAINSNLLLTMVYAASVSPRELADEAREYGRRIADPLLRARPLLRDKDPERKLRVGYVSPDLRDHAVTYFVEPLIKLHDRKKFEIFAYSNALYEDHVTERLKQEFDVWRDIRKLSDDEAADLIEADKIDILIDLAGHTGYNRLPVFARKPAPVQVTWLGHPATTGMKAMDYRITDPYAEPEGMTEHLNTETLWRLPEIFCCYGAHESNPAVIDHPPFEDNGYITFGCFNNFSKVTDPVLEVWAKIMAQIPDSRLLLEIRGIDSPPFRDSVEERLRRFGLPMERVILEPRKRSNQFVLYNKIDIALDPFPCAGGTTSMDALWMGAPFVTLAGNHFVSRMGVTFLTNIGLPELIAHNAGEYVKIATDLARNKDRLRALRHNLRERVTASPLMDQERFTRNMEAAWRGMWRKWRSKNT